MANPPITVGDLANVPAAGSPIASKWAQDVTSRVVSRWPAGTNLNAAYATATPGTVAVIDGGGAAQIWHRFAAGWSQIWPPQIVEAVGSGGQWGGNTGLAQLTVPASNAPQRTVHLSANVLCNTVTAGPAVEFVISTAGTAQTRVRAAAAGVFSAVLAVDVPVLSAGALVTLGINVTAPSRIETYADRTFNLLQATVS